MAEASDAEPTEAALLERAAALGIAIPADRRADILAGARRLAASARLVRDFAGRDRQAPEHRTEARQQHDPGIG